MSGKRKEGRRQIQALRRRLRFLESRIAARETVPAGAPGGKYDEEEAAALRIALAYWEVCFGVPVEDVRRILAGCSFLLDLNS